MFDTLGERLNKALDGVRGSGNLTEDQVKKVTREIRLALLEADVNYGVVKEFVSNVRERATGAEEESLPHRLRHLQAGCYRAASADWSRALCARIHGGHGAEA